MSSTQAVTAGAGLFQFESVHLNYTSKSTKYSSSERVVSKAGVSHDAVSINLSGVYDSLTSRGKEIVAKLNELLNDKLPNGIEGLDPSEFTSDKTAQRIVDGVTGLFGVFAKQNQDLQGEELISEFMKTIRRGVKQGYKEASDILGGLGAFDFNGVKEGIEKTMQLVEEKLVAFETDYRQRNGLTPKDDTEVKAAAISSEELAKQVAGSPINVTA